MAKEFHGSFNLICDKYFQDQFKFKESSFPEMCIIEKENIKCKKGNTVIYKKYKFTETKFSISKMKKFIISYYECKIPTFLISEPIPEKQEAPVYKIVGNIFNSTVIEKGM